MITEVKERTINRDIAGTCYCFDAIVKDGEVTDIDNLYTSRRPHLKTVTIETYIVFLQEVLQAIKETS